MARRRQPEQPAVPVPAPRALLTAAQFRDVLGAEDRLLELRRHTVIFGRNATGKSTCVESIRAAIGKVSLRGLAHRGGEAPARPMVKLLFEGQDGSATQLVRNAQGQELSEWIASDFVSQPGPSDRVRALIDATAANPISFDRAKADERLRMLLLAIPVTLDRARVEEIVRPSAVKPAGVPEGIPALLQLDMVRAQVFEARRVVGRDRDQKDATAADLQADIPERPDLVAAGRVVEAAVEAERAARAKVTGAAAEARSAAKRGLDDALAASLDIRNDSTRALHNDLENWEREERAALELRISKRREAVAAEVNAANDAHAERVRVAGVARSAAVDAADLAEREGLAQLAPLVESVSKAREARAAAQEREERYQGALALSKRAAEAREMGKAHAARYAAMTAVIDELDAYRTELASSLPPGLALALVDGELHIEVRPADGGRPVLVPYEQANSAARWRVASLVSALRVAYSTWPLILIDDAEKLDPANRAALLAELARYPVQVVMAVVADCDFRVEYPDFPELWGATVEAVA